MKNITRKLALLMTFAIMFSMLLPLSEIGAASKIKLNKKSATVYVGSTVTLKLSGAKKADVKWTTSNKKVATVTSAGKVKGKKKGTATITATYKGKEYTCKVKVKKPSLNYTKAEMNPGETLELKLTGTTAKKWKSSNTKVAKVSKGVVTAVAKGTATITVTGKDKKKYKLKVTVYNIPEEKLPVVSFDLSTAYTGGSITDIIPNSALSASLHGVGPKDVDFGKTIKDEYREKLWQNDDTVIGFAGVSIIDDEKKYPTEGGYVWVKAALLTELIERQKDGNDKLIVTADDIKKAKIADEDLTLRYTDDVFRSPLDEKKAGKDGYITFSLTAGGREFTDCKFKAVTEIDERTWYVHKYTVAYIKLPALATTELILTVGRLDDILKNNTSADSVTSYGLWSPYSFSPIVCSVPAMRIYSAFTQTNKSITKWDKGLCGILGLEFTGEEDD